MLSNIRGFEHLDLDLSPADGKHYAGWSVVTGDNGSGKSALLRSVALALLGPAQSRSLVPSFNGWVRNGETTGSISVEVRPDHHFDTTARGGYPVQSTFWAELEIQQEKSSDIWTAEPGDIFRHKKRSATNGPWALSTGGWFAVGYGPFRRMYGSSPDAQRLMVIPGRLPRFATLFKEDATLAEGEEWLRELNYQKLEHRPDADLRFSNLLELISADFLRHGVTVHGVDSTGIILGDATGRPLPLVDMSDGYRSSLAMLVDIFRHMVNVYGPNILARDDEGRVHVNRPGVVLIDEIDAHLHPGWQREIGFWLVQHFPLVQFIVTTHSPLICQAADQGRVYHLPQPGEGDPFRLRQDDYQRVIAGRADQVLLTPAFGLRHTRSPLAVRKRERHAELRAKQLGFGQLSSAESNELEQLSLFAQED